MDETWVNAGECYNEMWVDNTVRSHCDAFLKRLTTGPKNPVDKGKHLIVVHIINLTVSSRVIYCATIQKLQLTLVVIRE